MAFEEGSTEHTLVSIGAVLTGLTAAALLWKINKDEKKEKEWKR